MPKFYSGRQVVEVLKRAGFYKVSQKGTHLKLRGIWNEKLQTVIIPMHKEIALGTFQSILRQADMTKEEFDKFVK